MATIKTYTFLITTIWASIFCAPVLAKAQVINEIMYNLPSGSDSGHEWIEVLNTASSSIDLSRYKLLENGTNHGIKAVGDSVVQVGAYAVVADNSENFKADNPGYSGLLFDSAFSLGNDGDKLVLKDAKLANIDSASYTGKKAAGDGNSMQQINGTFVSGTPTPGRVNTSVAIPPKEIPAKVVKPKAVKVSVTRVSKSKTTKAKKHGAVSEDATADPSLSTAPTETEIADQVAAAARALPESSSQSSLPLVAGTIGLALLGSGAVIASRRMVPALQSTKPTPPIQEYDPAEDFEITDISDDDEFEEK